jgi:hypothetical protein
VQGVRSREEKGQQGAGGKSEENSWRWTGGCKEQEGKGLGADVWCLVRGTRI